MRLPHAVAMYTVFLAEFEDSSANMYIVPYRVRKASGVGIPMEFCQHTYIWSFDVLYFDVPASNYFNL